MTPRVLATRMTNTAAMRSLQGSESASSQDDSTAMLRVLQGSGRGGGMMTPRVGAGSQHDKDSRHLQLSGQRQDQSSMLPKASQPCVRGRDKSAD